MHIINNKTNLRGIKYSLSVINTLCSNNPMPPVIVLHFINGIVWVYNKITGCCINSMRGYRKFCLRGSKFDSVFWFF